MALGKPFDEDKRRPLNIVCKVTLNESLVKELNFENFDIFAWSQGLQGCKALTGLLPSPAISCVIGKDAGVSDDWSGKLAVYCAQQGIDYTFRENNSHKQANYDLVFAIGWRWIIRDVPQEKLVIFHDSLLPKYRGFAPLVNALKNKEKTTGVTALLGAEEYDRAIYPIFSGCTFTGFITHFGN